MTNNIDDIRFCAIQPWILCYFGQLSLLAQHMHCTLHS